MEGKLKRRATLYLEDYSKLLASLARRVKSGQSCVEFEDLLQVGYLSMLEAASTWDPELGKFSTYLHHTAYGHMRKYRDSMMKFQVEELNREVPDPRESSYNQERSVSLLHKIRSSRLKKEALFVVKLVLNAPSELTDLTESGIKRYLICCKGWNVHKTLKAVRAVKKFVKEEL